MDEEILKKLDRRVDRRSFLRGSGLAAAAVAGVTAFPLLVSGQEPPKSQDAGKDDKASDAPKGDQDKSNKDKEKDKEKDSQEAGKAGQDPFKETKKDEKGRDYRLCPQCGYNMYKQDRTWTCENCGYSYDE